MTNSTNKAVEDAANRGVHAVTPHIVCAGAADAIQFYKDAFAAKEMIRLADDDGKVMHACLCINGSSVMLADEYPEMESVGPNALGGSPVTIHLSVDDADAWVERAAKAGATVVMPVAEMFWGDRYGVIKDPFGHRWSMSTPVRTLTEDELREAARAAMANPCH
jgi:PhnB protein